MDAGGNFLRGVCVQVDRMSRAFAVVSLVVCTAVVAWQGDKPEGFRFTVKLADGRDAYPLGEPIPMRFEFGPGRWINELTRPHDVTWDWLVAEGGITDVMEPALDFDMAPLGCGHVDLRDGPYAIDTFVNEWLRFPAPGRYRFFVRTFRAGIAGHVGMG